MFKNFIKRIAEAVLALIVPIITSTKNDIIAKMDVQSNEVTGIRNLVNSIIAKLQDNETCIKEMAKRLANQESEIELLKSQLAEIKEQQSESMEMQSEIKTQNAEIQTKCADSVEKIMSSVESLGDNIPTEFKQKQVEARVQTLFDVKSNEDAEKQDYEKIAKEIYRQSDESDVVIKDELRYEVIRRLLMFNDITVSFENGKMVVAKKSTIDIVGTFDPEAIRKLRRDSHMERQLEFIKEKITEQINEFKLNPFSYETVYISKSLYYSSDIPDDDPMYVDIGVNEITYREGKNFFIYSEVLDLLLKYGMVLDLVEDALLDYDIHEIRDASGQFVLGSNKSIRWHPYYQGYYFGKIKGVRLHILTSKQKEVIGKM